MIGNLLTLHRIWHIILTLYFYLPNSCLIFSTAYHNMLWSGSFKKEDTILGFAVVCFEGFLLFCPWKEMKSRECTTISPCLLSSSLLLLYTHKMCEEHHNSLSRLAAKVSSTTPQPWSSIRVSTGSALPSYWQFTGVCSEAFWQFSQPSVYNCVFMCIC